MFSSWDAIADSFETPKTDASLVKIRTVVQTARTGNKNMETHVEVEEKVIQEAVNPVSCGRSSGDSDVNAYCE